MRFRQLEVSCQRFIGLSIEKALEMGLRMVLSFVDLALSSKQQT